MAPRRRRSYDGYSEYPTYVSVAEKRAKAEKSLAKLKKKNPSIKPVIIKGTAISTSWWGKAWNKNLESYADFSNRISRGRSYVRTGAVLDLRILPGEITGMVQGTRAKPYSVTINIEKIPPAAWKHLEKACAGKLDSLQDLLAGKFPKKLGELFTERGKGLFPSPREIDFSCTCPDYAFMCKHVAAVLYGVSARLDSEPGLFFTLRKVKVEDLVSKTVQSKSEELLDKAKKKSSRVIEDSDLSAIFGIQLDEAPVKAPPKASAGRPAKRSTTTSKTTSTKTPKRKKHAPRKKPANETGPTPIDIVESIIRESKEGVDAIELKHKTGMDIKEIRAIISKLKREGRIRNLARGLYTTP